MKSPEFDVGNLQQICQSDEMLLQVCSCRQHVPLQQQQHQQQQLPKQQIPSQQQYPQLKHHQQQHYQQQPQQQDPLLQQYPRLHQQQRQQQQQQEQHQRLYQQKSQTPSKDFQSPAFNKHDEQKYFNRNGANTLRRIPFRNNKNPTERRHVAFLKTHKAASSTLLNIFYRFASERDLVVLLPKNGNYHSGTCLNKTQILPPPIGQTYDILCNHAIFNYSSWNRFLPEDTVYVGIVRAPFERFVSAFYYYRGHRYEEYLNNIPGNRFEILVNYLKFPQRWEPLNPRKSMTNNRMTIDFGYPPSLFNNDTAFNEYLLHLNHTFRLVLDANRFDESLILMKRALRWTLKDILYIPLNKAKFKLPLQDQVLKLKQNIQAYLRLDTKLYSFFKEKLDNEIALQDKSFSDEVKHFIKVRKDVEEFCKYYHRKREVVIHANTFTKTFSINRRECRFMNMAEINHLRFIYSNQRIRINRAGVNWNFFNSLP